MHVSLSLCTRLLSHLSFVCAQQRLSASLRYFCRVFAALHAPWYNSNTAHQQEGETMRVAVEPLFYAGGEYRYTYDAHPLIGIGCTCQCVVV